MTKKFVVKGHPEIEIVGTLEVVHGVAKIEVDETQEDGWDYTGGTDIYWNTQQTVKRQGETVYVDDEGMEYLQSQIELVEIVDPTNIH